MRSAALAINKLSPLIKKKNNEDDDSEGSDLLSKVQSSLSNEEALRHGGVYYIYGEIKEGSLLEIHQDVLLKHFMGPKHWKGDLVFLINSPGGSVDETHGLLDLLGNISMDIRTVGLGQCASAAAVLLASGTPGKRIIGKSTMVMIHCYTWGAAGKHHELVAHRKAQNATYELEVQFWMKHSKYKTKKDVEKYLLRKEDTYLTAKEALRHGIIDRIADSVI
jgi:ATP-dependent Clp endopeptidase proteolytic subunit ClpP